MTMTADSVQHLVQAYGLLLLFPLAILEGPIVTVIAGWACRTGGMSLPWAFTVLVLADLVGDLLLYGLGRWGHGRLSPKWQRRLNLTDATLARVSTQFAQKGGRILVLAKLTHSFGLPVLVAAGAARMNVAAFLGYNLVGTLPKTAAFLALGYLVGHAYAAAEVWIGRGSLIILLTGLLALGLWLWCHFRKTAP